jgi:hypothetical protein
VQFYLIDQRAVNHFLPFWTLSSFTISTLKKAIKLEVDWGTHLFFSKAWQTMQMRSSVQMMRQHIAFDKSFDRAKDRGDKSLQFLRVTTWSNESQLVNRTRYVSCATWLSISKQGLPRIEESPNHDCILRSR